jgi:PDZ domain-containing protein
VAGQADAAPPQVGAAEGRRIRGRIVAHRLSMSDPDAPAAGDRLAIPSPRDVPAAAWERPRRRRWPIVLVVLVVLVVAAGWIAARVSVDYYVITPGEASPVSQYIEVPPSLNHPLTGKILLTDVFVAQLNALSYLQYKYFGSNDEIYSGADLLGGAPSEGQFLNQGYLQMAQAQSFATASALTYLGYTVKSTNAGALVYGIEPHSPASGTLQLGQVIEAVDGKPTATDCALVEALHGLQPGTRIPLTVEESSINDVGTLVPGPVVQKSVTLGTPPKGLIETGCGPPSKPTAFLGIDPETQQDWDFPVDVKINTPQIGGPSAGLAMTLGIIDKLSSGRLTGHTVVAATGTIDQYGNVGQVGGVPEKTIAVEQAGATVFFVPKPELSQAQAKATPQLHVYGVNTLDQALQVLKRLGGNVPPNPVPT